MTPAYARMIRCPDCGIMRPIHQAHCECGSHNLPEYRGDPSWDDEQAEGEEEHEDL